MKYNGFKWSVKVWLSSSLITPIIVAPIMISIGRGLETSVTALVSAIAYLVLAFLVISMVPWLIVQLFLKQIVNSNLSGFSCKMIIFLVVVMLPGILLMIGAVSSKPSDWTGMFGYLGFVIATALCLWFHRLKAAKNVTIKQPSA